MYEKFSQQPISSRQFGARLLRHLLAAVVLLLLSLLAGTLGYAHYAQMPWPAALLNASLLLCGVGLAQFPDTASGQLFVSLYALYAGLIYLVLSGILIAPLLHRFLHHFHWTDDD